MRYSGILSLPKLTKRFLYRRSPVIFLINTKKVPKQHFFQMMQSVGSIFYLTNWLTTSWIENYGWKLKSFHCMYWKIFSHRLNNHWDQKKLFGTNSCQSNAKGLLLHVSEWHHYTTCQGKWLKGSFLQNFCLHCFLSAKLLVCLPMCLLIVKCIQF